LNAYARSKHEFDVWAHGQPRQPPFWYGLKFFDVYGPGEGHKGRMASTVFHALRQMEESACIQLFRSHRDDVADGQQKRDFIYVADVVSILMALSSRPLQSGIYNLGTGQARSFLALAQATR
jgi:ADP-L-glycero-D-manno-heptose 6-epimerase